MYFVIENFFLLALSFVATIVAATATKAQPAANALLARIGPTTGTLAQHAPNTPINAAPAAVIHAISATVAVNVIYTPPGSTYLLMQ